MFLFVSLLPFGTARALADQFVLRSGERIKDVEITSIDYDGISLSNERVLRWSQIESGDVGESQRDDFQRWLQELGLPLFRMEIRLKQGNPMDALPFAEPLQDVYGEQLGYTGFVVNLTLLRGKLSKGDRVPAYPALLRVIVALEQNGWSSEWTRLLGDLNFDRSTLICEPYFPIWDSQEAAQLLPLVVETMKSFQGKAPRILYGQVAALALQANNKDLADKTIASLPSDEFGKSMRDMLDLQQSILSGQLGSAAQREKLLNSPSIQLRALGLYWMGRGYSTGNARNRQLAALEWLQIAADWGDLVPTLAGESLWLAGEAIRGEDESEAAVIHAELVRRFPHSIAASRVEAKGAPKTP
jgi:hypothetical protein